MGAEVGVAGVAVPPEAKRRRVVAAKPTAAAAGGKRPRRVRRPTALQRLFQACRAVFQGPGTVPAPSEVDLLRAILGQHPSPSPLYSLFRY
jgi:cysteamine dioxygenase